MICNRPTRPTRCLNCCNRLFLPLCQEKQGIFRELGGVLDIVVVNADEFAAGEHIFARHFQKLLQGFLLAVGELQEIFVRHHPAVEVDALKGIKMVRQIVLGTFLRDERQVKIIAVEVDKIAVGLGKIKESLYHRSLLLIGLGHPLYGSPFSRQEIGAADQVQAGGLGGEPGGLYVEKKDAL